MAERYPFIQFVIDAAQVIAAAAALVVFIGGTVSACHRGGVGGLMSFFVAAAAAVAAYVVVMVKIEALRVFLDIESSTRQVLTAKHERTPPGSAS